MDIIRSIFGLNHSSDGVDSFSKGKEDNEKANCDNESVVISTDHASSQSLTVDEVVDSGTLYLERNPKATSIVSLSADNSERLNVPCARIAPFIGIGKMERPKWVPKSRNNIKKMKYYGINDFGYHLFKVWYVDLMEFEWEYRDFEELIETFPHLRELCIEEIRKGDSVDNVPVYIQGAHSSSRIEHDHSSQSRYEDIPFQSSSKLCAQYSFLNVMGMGQEECDYLHQLIPGGFTNMTYFAKVLKPAGFLLQKQVMETDKVDWLITEANVGKYIVAGNGHVVGIHIRDNKEAIILDPAEFKTKRLNKRNLEYSIGNQVDDIRLIHDYRPKSARRFNCFQKQGV